MKAYKETRGKRTQNILVKSVLTQQKYQKIQADSSFPVIVKGLILGTHSLSDVKRLAKKYKVHSKTILKIAGMENFTGINRRFPQIDTYIKEGTVSSFPKATELRAIMGQSFSFSTVFGSKPIEFLMECGYPIFNTKLKIVFNGDLVKKPDQDKYYHKEKNKDDFQIEETPIKSAFLKAMNGRKPTTKKEFEMVLGNYYKNTMSNEFALNQDIISKYMEVPVKKLSEMNITNNSIHFDGMIASVSRLESLKKDPQALRDVIEIITKTKEVEAKRGQFFDDLGKCIANKVSSYTSYEPKGNKKVKEILGRKIPDIIAEYNGDISFLEIANYNNKSNYIEGIEDKINKVYNAKKKIAIVYTNKIKKKIESMYAKLPSTKKKFVEILYIDPTKDEVSQMLIACQKWLKWSKIPYNKNISAKDIFISK